VTIDGQINTNEANNRTVQELSQEQKQLQATIDGEMKREEALNQTVKTLCGQPKDVSTYKLESVTINKLTEIPPALNIISLWPNTLVC
jgi:hypothetical protein